MPGLEAGLLALVVVGRPHVEVGGGDPRGAGVPTADGDDLGGRRVGAGEGLGDACGSVAGRDADDDGVGDLAGRALADDGDGAHAPRLARALRR